MNSFWPEDLSLDDTQPPYEVLKSAREEWERETGGAMTLVLQQAESESNDAMIIVHAKHVATNRTATLLSVIHRPNEPYPATIQPRREKLPNILKRSYYEPGTGELASALSMSNIMTGEGQTVTNEWVSDTPSEFREKLSKAFNSSPVKTAILALACDVSSGASKEEEDKDNAG
uniref:Uncharacterized protein n=1 Tax=Candidatus Kentrum sp. MB TaxID=2138164 RepID=A0A451BBP0_9GAMM|nr:MAG: hypothetical protein BECKMB1821G_GA0114241_102924 [Candidatus Kentron sp. MB]VFK33043.1 MAG: hypothetical protein BECKMB1821I_GA0114274_103925 [Candidatus Kentron sp. MB]VFK75707.1 MAG: hypothetical protein BECKMB1821H_GA0114242_102925 [Candidatus Kentron sp. MB]